MAQLSSFNIFSKRMSKDIFKNLREKHEWYFLFRSTGFVFWGLTIVKQYKYL